ncbi:hypothetical protein NON20_15360 [Synechocystis sp. B12]|nr:hypothetical protein NON20_15360 [Synechocystis sp. B12]
MIAHRRQELAQQYYQALHQDVLPFWEKYSLDHQGAVTLPA